MTKSDAQATGDPLALRLHQKIYPASAVKEAAAAFAELCEVTVEKAGDYHELAIVPLEEGDSAELLDEFANYALSRATRNR